MPVDIIQSAILSVTGVGDSRLEGRPGCYRREHRVID
jgi:hypothetical protein